MPDRRTVKIACLLFITGGLLLTVLINNYTVRTARANRNGNCTNCTLIPTALSSAPGESNCATCHFLPGTPAVLNSSRFTVTAPPAYVPGQTYQITVSHTAAAGEPFAAFGFQLTVVKDSDGNSVGTLQSLGGATALQSGTATDFDTGETYTRTWINHTSASVVQGGNSATWTFNWTAPPADVGPITFHAAGVQGNNNEKSLDDSDQTYLRKVTLQAGSGPPPGLSISSVEPPAGRASGGQQVTLKGSFAGLSTVTFGGVVTPFTFTNGTTEITLTTPQHAAGAVGIALTSTSGSTVTKTNAFAYLPTTFTDNTLSAGVTTAKAQHVIELRRAVDSLRAVAALPPAQWTDAVLQPSATQIKAVHIQQLRTNLEQAAAALGYPAAQYTDPTLAAGTPLKRAHIEELRQRIRTIAG